MQPHGCKDIFLNLKNAQNIDRPASYTYRKEWVGVFVVVVTMRVDFSNEIYVHCNSTAEHGLQWLSIEGKKA